MDKARWLGIHLPIVRINSYAKTAITGLMKTTIKYQTGFFTLLKSNERFKGEEHLQSVRFCKSE